ncbi:F-box/kelch-repeat protein At3g23880-like [Rutidosis leptorrhynchoides]|uniref:F-box/kelch-repeat protein At3g23880-like n=1 Tax=Rutidosis leptorrhynchoides TaxID=125765 RepID=UPI003A9A51EE
MSALNHLPPDLIEAVLPFLPPKSLGRIKSVSKRWYSLISSPNFIKTPSTHIQKFTKNNPNSDPTQLILVESDGESLYSVSIKQLNTQTSLETVKAKCLNLQELLLEIHGSCNGLVINSYIFDNLFLVNPTTRETLDFPFGKSSDETYGFGYDASAHDYKVISISRRDSDTKCKIVRVYSLRNNSCNMLTNFPYQLSNHHKLSSGVLLNNNLHWVVRTDAQQ